MRTARHALPWYRLVGNAIGPLDHVPGKLHRLGAILAEYGSGALAERLQRMKDRGLIEAVPNPVQLFVGSVDMVRFWISPAAADYYREQNISYAFHQVLRFFDEPASLADPVGFFSTADNIIGHLMQVVHANPVYDLQLLDAEPNGLDELCAQLRAMIDGTHPRAQSIGAIVEEPDYHARLLAYVERWRNDRTVPPILRSNVSASPELSELEATFGSLTEAMRYFCRLPRGLAAGLRHVATVHAFPRHLGAKAN